ncbi:hypothetical protein N1027_00520 [Herbiconiux sp. CPCC 205763]|uniref:Uncharacterized protein n=1 Tax=Herbiconiux aconitum TaxID=2970913 RepID=A0ABT2GK69_9MICO|nr:hypothetical protein [Herbiconiux aconitum]MCS5716615.1 hypothetical protein [Herbiconiux aconitum]
MARTSFFRVSVSSAIALAAVLGMSGCIGAAGSPTPTATVPSPTPTVQPTITPTPTNTGVVPNPTPTPTPTTPAVKTVSVQILNSSFDPSTGAIAVAGMVTDLVSSTGTCTATASQDGQSVSAEAAGMADAAVTYCSGLSLALPAGSTGSWTVELVFTDEGHSGSAQIPVDVS